MPHYATGRIMVKPLRCVSRHRPLHKTGRFGELQWTRPYWVCGAGHGGWAPADDALALGPEHFTPALAHFVIEQAIDRPFDQVPAIVESAGNIPIDGETVRRVTERLGQQAEQREQTQIAAVAAGDREIVNQDLPEPEALMVAVDGAMVHFREDQAWHEVTGGVSVPLALSGSLGPGIQGIQASPDYCVGLESRAEFWSRMEAHAVQNGLEAPRCHLIPLLGDGAHGIGEEGALHLHVPGKTLVNTLDIFHAREHLWAFAAAQFGSGTEPCTTWASLFNDTLEAHGVGPILNALAECSSQDARDPEAAHTHAQYFSNQQTRRDYPRYARMGLPIGSGIIEGACKTVLKQRLSASGMRWTRPGAQAVATLRALHRSHQWDAWWHTQPYGRTAPSVA